MNRQDRINMITAVNEFGKYLGELGCVDCPVQTICYKSDVGICSILKKAYAEALNRGFTNIQFDDEEDYE